MIAYPVGSSGQTLIITDAVLAHFDRHRQLTPRSNEAGGQLFARIEGAKIIIERATGPRASDRRAAFSFIPNRLAERREIKQLFKAGLHYVGDWHTHAEPNPRPSETDLRSFREMFRKSRRQLESFVMIIVGAEPMPDGLYVAVCKECDPITLRPVAHEPFGPI